MLPGSAIEQREHDHQRRTRGGERRARPSPIASQASTAAQGPAIPQMYMIAERIMLKTMHATAAWTIDRLVAIPTPSAPSRFFAL